MDAEFALDYVKQHARTPEQQQAVLAVLRTKCDILWAMLDALHLAYVDPGNDLPCALHAAGVPGGLILDSPPASNSALTSCATGLGRAGTRTAVLARRQAVENTRIG